MKKYLKMSYVFKRQVSDVEVSFLTLDHHNRACDEYAAHAINSHDELVQMSNELLSELEAISKAYVNLLGVGKDRIEALGGQCDEVLYMAAHDSALVRACSIIGKYSGGAQ